MHTTTTLLPTCDIACEEDEPSPDGMYGPAHWLDDRGISALLAPYLCDGWDLGDYARFADLTGLDARRLSTLYRRTRAMTGRTTRLGSSTCCAPPRASTGSRSRDTSSGPLAETNASASTPCSSPSRQSSHTPVPPSTRIDIRAFNTGSRYPRSSALARKRCRPTK